MIENDYIDVAEKVILDLKNKVDKKGRPIPMVTTSKIRNLLAMTADIYNEVVNQVGDKLSDEVCDRINYLRVRFIYEVGRDDAIKKFVIQAKILEKIQDIKSDKKKYIDFNRYMEALVAFHKFHGGKDN